MLNKSTSDYRLKQINDIQSYLEDQSERRRHLSKRYSKTNKVITSADGILSTTTLGLGVTGVVLLSTVVATPIVLVMESASIGTGFLCAVAKYVNKKLSTKEEKHRQIHILAESKLNTIQDHISKAINDGYISDEEFKMILDEADKYRKMKEDLRIKNIKESEKDSLIEKGRSEIMKKFENFYNSEIRR